MKKSVYTLLLLFIYLNLFAQTPQKYNYQAVARDASGNPIANSQIGLRITIHQASASGTAVYQETHLPATNQFGLFSIEIGTGTVVSGAFNAIGWGSNTYYQQVELDPNGATGGLTYTNMGATQLISVPYALYAKEAGSVTGGGGGSNGWNLTGNAATNPTTNFVGTTDAQPLKFRVNNQPAGQLSTTNAAIGVNALTNNTSGAYNTALGVSALTNNTTGNENTAAGSFALTSNSTGMGNAAFGSNALLNSTTGNNNTAMGSSALRSNTDGYENAATGYQALYNNTTGIFNTANGTNALFSNTTGGTNTATGRFTLYNNTTGNNNTATGGNALQDNTTGNYNTAHGASTLYNNTTGSQNTATGANALHENTTGANNAAIGANALFNNTTGYSNVAMGAGALFNNINRSNLVAIGDSALFNNGLGVSTYFDAKNNVAVGSKALYSNTTGEGNTANGTWALIYNTTGYSNTANGQGSLHSNTTGYFNTANGMDALYLNTTGSYNIGMGYDAGFYNIATANNQIAIGNTTGTGGGNKAIIGNSSQTWIGGQVGWSAISDARIKEQVQADVPGLSFIKELRPVTYHLNIHKQKEIMDKLVGNDARTDTMPDWEGKYDIEQIKMTGFLAQEVEAAAKKVNYDFSGVDVPKIEGGLYSLRYAEFVVPLVKAVQEQQVMIEELKTQNAVLQQKSAEVDLLKANEQKQQSAIEQQNNTIEQLKAEMQQLKALLEAKK